MRTDSFAEEWTESVWDLAAEKALRHAERITGSISLEGPVPTAEGSVPAFLGRNVKISVEKINHCGILIQLQIHLSQKGHKNEKVIDTHNGSCVAESCRCC